MKGWLVRFKDRAPEPAQLTYLATEFCEDLIDKGVNQTLFEEMNKLVKRKVKFFPTMADLLDCREEAEMNLRGKQKYIPYTLPELTDKEHKEGCKKLDEIKWHLFKELGMK